MATAPKLEPTGGSPVSGFGPHIEDLHDFFRSRGVQFGSPADLQPFIERLQTDASFRDETASMVRTIIYLERDRLSGLELMELLASSVAGSEVDNAAPPEIRHAVRSLMTFVEGVFRTRRDPGAPVDGAASKLVPQRPEVSAQKMESAVEKAPVAHPTTDLFYRAQMAANASVAEAVAGERRPIESAPPIAEAPAAAAELPEPEDDEFGQDWHIPLEDFAPPQPERGPQAWLWIAGVCALMLAFSAGLIVHQHMLVPLRDPNQPYQTPPVEAAASAPAQPIAAPQSSAIVDADWRARAPSTKAETPAAANELRRVEPVSEVELQPRYMPPATIGAPAALMASRLVYAPPPGYPALAKITHIQGRVLVQAVVGKSGHVIRADAISGHRLLRGAAVREVYERRYRPYLLDGRPRDVAMIVPVDFRLK